MNPDQPRHIPASVPDASPETLATAHPASWPEAKLRAACDLRFERRRGPGGQHRNKVETAVVLRHRDSGLEGAASERRSQADNLNMAIRRLRLRLALHLRQAWTTPSRRWVERCRHRRINVSPRHDDFAALLAEALDALHALDWQVTQAADRLGCSRSQLVRLLRQEPEALWQLNQQRAERGAGRLK